MNAPQHFRETLLRELTTVVERHAAAPRRTVVVVPGRRGLARLSAAVAGIAVLAVGASVLLAERSGSQAFAVTRLPDGRIEIAVQEDFDDPAALASELQAVGIAVRSEEILASPSRVGEVVTLQYEHEDVVNHPGVWLPWTIWPDDAQTTVIDPALVRDKVFHLQVGVPTAPGQPYGPWAAGSPFAPGEVLDGLHCALGDEPFTVGELAPHLEALDRRIEWIGRSREPENYGAQEVVAFPPPVDPIEKVYLVSPETITAVAGWWEHVATSDDAPLAYDPATGQNVPLQVRRHLTAHERYPCTPELAARWG